MILYKYLRVKHLKFTIRDQFSVLIGCSGEGENKR